MHYTKIEFLIVIISIVTSTMIIINVAVLLQAHLQSQIVWNLLQLDS